MDLMLAPVIAAILAMLFVVYIWRFIRRQSIGTDRMKEIAGYIQEGANTFMKREVKTIFYFTALLTIALLVCLWPRWQIAFAFLLGVFSSFLAIAIGMGAAVKANVRTANAARTLPEKAVKLAFQGGGIG